MVLFPPCKINLGLRVLGRREDGYHDLETVFYPVGIKDVLEIMKSEGLVLTPSGLMIQGEPSANLCMRAYELLKKDFPDLPPVHIHLYKNIPMGAGLGGGSSDGAFMLKMLNEEFRLELAPERLADYALELGSDCPFFLVGQPCIATSRGEVLKPIRLDLSSFTLAIICPELKINTSIAFSQFRRKNAIRPPLEEIVAKPIENWRGLLENDFEEWACNQYPELSTIAGQLYGAGALYAGMTGSGSAFYGVFPGGNPEEGVVHDQRGSGIALNEALFPKCSVRIVRGSIP